MPNRAAPCPTPPYSTTLRCAVLDHSLYARDAHQQCIDFTRQPKRDGEIKRAAQMSRRSLECVDQAVAGVNGIVFQRLDRSIALTLDRCVPHIDGCLVGEILGRDLNFHRANNDPRGIEPPPFGSAFDVPIEQLMQGTPTIPRRLDDEPRRDLSVLVFQGLDGGYLRLRES